jgi:predicted RNA-binding protein (virulence factor B family)
MLHDERVEKYLWLSFGANVYVNVTWDVGKISMTLSFAVNVYVNVTWDVLEKYLWLSFGVNVYVNVTWDGGKITMTLSWSKCLCKCYMRWLKNINDSLLE